MTHTYTLPCKALGNTYEFQITADVTDEDASTASVRLRLFRTDQPVIPWEWSGPLTGLINPLEFNLRLDDGVNIKGRFMVFGQRKQDKGFLFMDAYYGLNDEEHFEGNLFEMR